MPDTPLSPSSPPSRPPSPPSRSSEPVLRNPDYLAGGLAIAWPGLGHIVQRRTKRGVLAMVGVLGLFLYGLFIGGIDAVDSREDRIWYYGAALVGPLTWGTDWVHQNHFKALDPGHRVPRTGWPGEVRWRPWQDPASRQYFGTPELFRAFIETENARLRDHDPEHPSIRSPDEAVASLVRQQPMWRAATPAELETGKGPPNEKGLGRLNEIAMLSIALAGMLNFIVFLDALIPGRGHKATGKIGAAVAGTASAGAAAAEGMAS